MNRDALLTRLEVHEGVKLRPYVDTAGKLTIGCGRNLTDNGISIAEARAMAMNDIIACEAELDQQVPWWRRLNEARQQVLCEMQFNMGWPRLSGFKLFFEALNQWDFEEAANQMLDSLWARQVGNRAKHLAAAMRSGSFE